LHLGRNSSAAAIALADDVAMLMSWLRHEILAAEGRGIRALRDMNL
jgi:hypothetical protein